MLLMENNHKANTKGSTEEVIKRFRVITSKRRRFRHQYDPWGLKSRRNNKKKITWNYD